MSNSCCQVRYNVGLLNNFISRLMPLQVRVGILGCIVELESLSADLLLTGLKDIIVKITSPRIDQ